MKIFLILILIPTAVYSNGPKVVGSSKSHTLPELITYVVKNGRDRPLVPAMDGAIGIHEPLPTKTLYTSVKNKNFEFGITIDVVYELKQSRVVPIFLVMTDGTYPLVGQSQSELWNFKSSLKGKLTAAAWATAGKDKTETHSIPLDKKNIDRFESLKNKLLATPFNEFTQE